MADEVKGDGPVPDLDPKAENSTADAVDRAIERWRADHLRDTNFSRDTGAWNTLQAALPELAAYIREETV